MGWITGDSLGMLGILIGCVMAPGIAGFTMTPGWRANVLWAVTVLFGLLLVAFFIFHGSLPSGLAPALGWAVMPPLIVGVVALMLSAGREKTEAAEKSKTIGFPVAGALTHTLESPNINLPNALKIVMRSTWAKDHKATVGDALKEMADKLAMHKLTAFGRPQPDAKIVPIPWKMWAVMKIELSEKAAAMVEDGKVIYRDLQFDRSYVLGAWPSPSGWGA